MYKVISSADRDEFTSFPIWMPLVCFFCHSLAGRTPGGAEWRGESRRQIAPQVRGKQPSVECDGSCRSSVDALAPVEQGPFYSRFVHYKWVSNFVKCLFYIC